MTRSRPHRPAISTRAALAVSLALHASVFGVAFGSGWPARPTRPPEAGVRQVSIRWADVDRAHTRPPVALRWATSPPSFPPAPPPPASLPDLLPDPVPRSRLASGADVAPTASVLASVRAVRPRPSPPAAATRDGGNAAAATPSQAEASPPVAAGEGSEAAPPPASAAGSVVIAPEPLDDNEPPRYPGTSRRRGEQGLVVVRAIVDVTGEVRDAVVVSSPGHARLDEAALRAVSAWRFTPARRDGRAVAHPIEVPIRFSLDG